MRVLVIPEDFVKDQYILKPLVETIMRTIGKPQAKITICMNPRLAGIGQALQWRRINDIIEAYKGMYDIFLLCVDRDGEENRRAKLENIEQEARQILDPKQVLFAVLAWQKVEIWALAGCRDLPQEWKWTSMRQEISFKQVYFDPYAKKRNVYDKPHNGREILGREAAVQYRRVRDLCEEVSYLEERVRQWIADN